MSGLTKPFVGQENIVKAYECTGMRNEPYNSIHYLPKSARGVIVAAMQNIRKLLLGGRAKITKESLRKWHVSLVVISAVEGGAILILGAAHTFPVTTLFVTTDSLQTRLTGETISAPALHQLFTVNLVGPVAALFFVTAVIHLLIATAWRTRYEAWLKKDINPLRWLEYVLSGGIIFVIIGLLVGVYDIGSLLLLIAMAIVIGLYGFALESIGRQLNRNSSLLLNSIGVIALVVPWVLLALYMLAASIYGSGTAIHIFVIYLVGLLLSLAIAANTYLLRAKRGNWANYIYGERWYMCLSLVAESLLAWLVFVGVLHP